MAGRKFAFEHLPLDPNRLKELRPIRLVKAYPAQSHNADIICENLHARLQENWHSYEALWYAWGNSEQLGLKITDKKFKLFRA
jgi:hypothetical protein